MSRDWFIRNFKKPINRDDLQKVLEDYFGGAGVVVPKKGYWIIHIPGQVSFPFRRLHPDQDRTLPGLRVITVSDADKAVMYIKTDLTDEFTNVVANGLANLITRYWEGERDPD